LPIIVSKMLREMRVLGAIAALLPFIPSKAGLVYWTDRAPGNRGVGVCRQDGADIRRPANLQGLTDPRGVAFSYRRGGLFFADSAGLFAVPRLPQGGLAPTPPAPLNAAAGVALRDIFLEEDDGWLYYADEGSDSITRVGLSNQPPDPPSLFPKAISNAYFLCVDSGAGVVLGGISGARLWRQAISASASSETLTWAPTLGIALDEVRGVCLDAKSGWLYWCDKDLARISRARYDGTAVLKAPLQILYSNLNAPHGLALDVPAGKLYWVDSGTNGGAGFGRAGVNRGDLDGSGPPESLVAPPDSAQPWDLCLDLSEITFSGYVARYFRKDDPDAIKARSADPDNDGSSNEIEFLLVRHPRHAEPEPALTPTTWTAIDGEVYPAVSYRTREGDLEMTVALEVSKDLVTWDKAAPDDRPAPVATSVTNLPDGVAEVMARSITSLRTQSSQFFRARLEPRGNP
jgi:hypothetical protein